MTFELPNLDVLHAEPVLAQLVRRIQGYTPGWTDYNPSDPGITLLQMLVWIFEGTGYTANAVPLETYRNMFRWVAGLSSTAAYPPRDADDAGEFPYLDYASTQSQDPAYQSLIQTLEQMESSAPALGSAALQEAVVLFRQAPFLAITPSDLSALTAELSAFIDAQQRQQRQQSQQAEQAQNEHDEHDEQQAPTPLHVARLCLRQRGDATDLLLVSDAAPAYLPIETNDVTGVVSVALAQPDNAVQAAQQEAALLDNVRAYLAARTLLGGMLSVRGAQLLYIDVQCTIRCFARERTDEAAAAVLSALEDALQPVRTDGGRDWAYGARIDASALRPVIASVPSVDQVQSVNVQVFLPAMVGGVPAFTPGVLEAGLPRLYRAWVTVLEAGDG